MTIYSTRNLLLKVMSFGAPSNRITRQPPDPPWSALWLAASARTRWLGRGLADRIDGGSRSLQELLIARGLKSEAISGCIRAIVIPR